MRATLPTFLQKFDLADLTGAAVLAGLAVAFVAGVVTPLAVRDRAAAGQARVDAMNAQRVAAITGGIRAAGDTVAGTQKRIAATPVVLRPGGALNQRLAVVVTLAGECGLGVAELRPGEPTRDKRFLATPVRLGGDGDYGGVSRLLHRLSTRMPDMAVSGFKLSAPTAGATAGRYTIELRWLATAEPTAPPAVVGVAP